MNKYPRIDFGLRIHLKLTEFGSPRDLNKKQAEYMLDRLQRGIGYKEGRNRKPSTIGYPGYPIIQVGPNKKFYLQSTRRGEQLKPLSNACVNVLVQRLKKGLQIQKKAESDT